MYNRHRLTKEERERRYNEALERAEMGFSKNDQIVYDAFTGAGYTNVQPRVTVLTFDAWRAKGRTVLRGQHGLKVAVYVTRKTGNLDEHGNPETVTLLGSARLFHISQTGEYRNA